MQKLNFPNYEFRLKSSENKLFIFDSIRKKFIQLTPEEWVRQHTVRFLIEQKNYPASLISVEKTIKIANLSKRYDIVAYNPNKSIDLLVECKAPEINITQNTFDQIARYNLILKAKYLMVTNGINTYICQIDLNNQKYIFLKELPEYTLI